MSSIARERVLRILKEQQKVDVVLNPGTAFESVVQARYTACCTRVGDVDVISLMLDNGRVKHLVSTESGLEMHLEPCALRPA